MTSASTETATTAYIIHHVTRLLEANDYIRCLLVDFSKAFATVSHVLLIRKLQKLDIPTFVINWIINFLTDRTQAVITEGKRSFKMSITRSIVQGLWPFIFIIYILDLRPLSAVNLTCKYADDLSQLCPLHTDTTLEEEYIHILRWADYNNLWINTSKTKEIVFKRPICSWPLGQYVPPPPITHIEQVDHVKLLGVFFTTSTHINSVIAVMNQRLRLLNQLRKQGLDIRGITQIFMGLVVAGCQYLCLLLLVRSQWTTP